MENIHELVMALQQDWPLQLSDRLSPDELTEMLAGYIHELIHSDFDRLLRLLYRVDVSESRLKQLLKENKNEDAGKIIAQLIIERQMQKIKTRQQFSRDDAAGDEERW